MGGSWKGSSSALELSLAMLVGSSAWPGGARKQACPPWVPLHSASTPGLGKGCLLFWAFLLWQGAGISFCLVLLPKCGMKRE